MYKTYLVCNLQYIQKHSRVLKQLEKQEIKLEKRRTLTYFHYFLVKKVIFTASVYKFRLCLYNLKKIKLYNKI